MNKNYQLHDKGLCDVMKKQGRRVVVSVLFKNIQKPKVIIGVIWDNVNNPFKIQPHEILDNECFVSPCNSDFDFDYDDIGFSNIDLLVNVVKRNINNLEFWK